MKSTFPDSVYFIANVTLSRPLGNKQATKEINITLMNNSVMLWFHKNNLFISFLSVIAHYLIFFTSHE